jgi:hypothetical protein
MRITFCRRLLDTVLLVAAAASTAALPTITTINVKQPILEYFEFEPEVELAWSAGSLPPPGW